MNKMNKKNNPKSGKGQSRGKKVKAPPPADVHFQAISCDEVGISIPRASAMKTKLRGIFFKYRFAKMGNGTFNT